MGSYRAFVVGGCVLVALGVASAQGGTSVAATLQGSTYPRDAYVKALIPVVKEEFEEDGLTATAEDYGCLADMLVEGFTLRRLRAAGNPATVALQRRKDDLRSFGFGVTKAQETRIMGTAMSECLGVARILAIGTKARGVDLSQPSVECLQARFESDPKAAVAYIEGTIREANHRRRVRLQDFSEPRSSCKGVSPPKN